MESLFVAFDGTNPYSGQQEEIFLWFKDGEGHLIVRARAGSGKTTTIVQGILYAPEKKILLAAFNKRIAEELNARIRNRCATAKTLHAVGYAFVIRNWSGVKVDSSGERGERLVTLSVQDLLGSLFPHEDPASFEIPPAILRLASKILTAVRDIAPLATEVEEILDVIYEFDHLPDLYLEERGWTPEVLAKVTLRALTHACERDAVIEFADMVFLPLRLNWAQPTYDLVCIDEAQDMNAGQLELARRVCKKGGRIVVVGDDRQAIYGFRGADSNSLDRLKQELNAKELGLTTTYRCPQQVVAYAACLVPDIQAAVGAKPGTISSIKAAELAKMVKPGDFVLSRSNAPLTKACLTLLRAGVRAKIVGRDIGQRLLNICKKLKARDVNHFYTRLGEWSRKEIDRAKRANRKSRIQLITDQADTLRALVYGLDHLEKLYARIEDLFGDPSAAYVICSSVHRAKGLEANRVFILQDTLYPGKDSKGSIEEENIEYVAVTRSKDQLIWVNGFNPKKRRAAAPEEAFWPDDGKRYEYEDEVYEEDEETLKDPTLMD